MITLAMGDTTQPVGATVREPALASVSGTTLAELFRDQYEKVIRVAYLLTGSQATAEDLVQDSFIRIQPKLGRLESPAAHLRTTVVNACSGHHRKVFRDRARFADLVTINVSPETPMIADVVAKLPYKQRVAVVLRYYEDRPDEEIAEVLSCRPATVRSLLHRGLQTLRKEIER
jgi:RNA polymerase sigma factor (sigma-70 family)